MLWLQSESSLLANSLAQGRPVILLFVGLRLLG